MTREATRKVGDLPDVRDPRVRAIVLMAPNTAPFTDDALAPVAVYRIQSIPAGVVPVR